MQILTSKKASCRYKNDRNQSHSLLWSTACVPILRFNALWEQCRTTPSTNTSWYGCGKDQRTTSAQLTSTPVRRHTAQLKVSCGERRIEKCMFAIDSPSTWLPKCVIAFELPASRLLHSWPKLTSTLICYLFTLENQNHENENLKRSDNRKDRENERVHKNEKENTLKEQEKTHTETLFRTAVADWKSATYLIQEMYA